MLRTMEARILSEELAWADAGYNMYFPESQELVEMLWRSKMDVRVEDLELENFPRAFAISWPKCLIEGVQPVGCMVWWGDGPEWTKSIRRFEKEYLWKGVLGIDETRGVSESLKDDRLGLHMSFCKEDAEAKLYGVKHSYYRSSVPHDLLVSGLASNEDFATTFQKYNNCAMLGIKGLSPEEVHIQYVTFKLVLRMMVYMRACPQFIKQGYPGGKNRKAFETQWDNFKPGVIGTPTRSGTHDSPSTHLRTWFFRSYPVKKDGTRKTGVVFVNATVVGAHIDPKTVEVGGHL